MKTMNEVRDCKLEMEIKAEYDLGRPFKERPLDAERFWGFLDALRWVLGEKETPDECKERWRRDHTMSDAEVERMHEVTNALPVPEVDHDRT